jgi:hypothetical protein
MEPARKNRLVEAFEEWAQDRGLLARLPMLRQGALRLLDEAGDEPITSISLEQIVLRAREAGANATTIDQLEQVGRAFLDFARATGVTFPRKVAPTTEAPVASSVAPPAVAPVAKVVAAPVGKAVFKPIAAPVQPVAFAQHLEAKQSAPAPKSSAIVGAVLLAILLLGALRWLHVQPIGPITGAHFAMADKGFAVIPPVGWSRITRALVDEGRKLGHAVPAEVEQVLFDKTIAVAFTRGFEATFPPSFNVVVTNDKFPTINNAARQEAVKQLEEMFQKVLKTYHVVNSAIIVVDRIKSLEISGMSTLPMNGLDTQVRTHQILVPGKNAGFFLTFTSLEADFDELRAISRRTLQSFVVMDRPPRFKPMFQTAILSGLVGALLSLLVYLGRVVMWYTSRAKKAGV